MSLRRKLCKRVTQAAADRPLVGVGISHEKRGDEDWIIVDEGKALEPLNEKQRENFRRAFAERGAKVEFR